MKWRKLENTKIFLDFFIFTSPNFPCIFKNHFIARASSWGEQLETFHMQEESLIFISASH